MVLPFEIIENLLANRSETGNLPRLRDPAQLVAGTYDEAVTRLKCFLNVCLNVTYQSRKVGREIRKGWRFSEDTADSCPKLPLLFLWESRANCTGLAEKKVWSWSV